MNISQTGATLSGSYSSVAGNVIERGFEYGLSESSLTSTAKSSTEAAEYSCGLNGLASNTTYYYRAYVKVQGTGSYSLTESTFYGDTKSFTTKQETLSTWLTNYEMPATNASSVSSSNTKYEGRYCHDTFSETYGSTMACRYNTSNANQKIVTHTYEYNSKVVWNYSFLYDKDKNGASYDWCYVIGDFSGWQRQSEYAMKRDDAAGCWWYTFTGVDPDREYMFQYYLGKKDGTATKVHDPYTEIVYDGYNDKYITSTTYPDLPAYPEGTSGLVSAFKVNKDSYSWQNTSFSVSDPDDIVIYEMHFRDFTSTGDINGAMEKLDYLQALGVNAIELMPVQEFEGNDSWGYNPCSYFALDKAYGTRRMYREFVDACHSRGIAVLVDVVYNQATGAHPYAKLYWDATNNKTASNNPWFNVDAPHPYSVFHDWNHEFELTREHVKKSLRYLIEEYRVDGFRFDLTKGFTNKNSTESTASNYDQSRIDILKDYNNAIREVKSDAIVILEHFCAQDEEKALAQAGMKVWRNMNNAYCQAAMGFSSDSDFSGLWTGSSMPFGSYVGFMESHDEERTAYKSKAYGNSAIKGNLSARMKREALNAAFFLTVPGPKMLWQFQELGYDESIETGGRTGKKPLHWEYYEDADRKALYDTYAKLLKFRRENPELFRSDASFSWKVGTGNWSNGRTITCSAGSKGLIVAGNFDLSAREVTVTVPEGNWKNYFTGEMVEGGNIIPFSLESGEFVMLVK